MKSIPCHLSACLFALVCALSCGARADEAALPRTSEQCIADHVAGQGLRLDGRFGAAAEEFKQCLHPSCSALLREDCAALLRAVEQETPSVVLAASDGRRDLVEVTVRSEERVLTTQLDGRALSLDAGPIRLTFEAPGMHPVSLELVIRAGERNRLVAVQLRPVALPAAEPAATIEREQSEARVSRFDRTGRILLASSLVLGATGGGLALGARHAFDEAERDCSPLCSRDDARRIDRLAYAADGLFLAAAATLMVTVVRIVWPRGPVPAAQVVVGPSQLRAEVRF